MIRGWFPHANDVLGTGWPRQINLPGWPHWGKHDLCYFDIFWQFIFFKSFALGCLSIVLGASEISVILSRVPYVSCACFARLVHLLFFGLGAGAVARWGVATPWTPKREPLDAGMGDYNYLFKCHGVESRMTVGDDSRGVPKSSQWESFKTFSGKPRIPKWSYCTIYSHTLGVPKIALVVVYDLSDASACPYNPLRRTKFEDDTLVKV